jgi:hypothetical protein
MALLQRMKEAELFKEWESQEDDVRRGVKTGRNQTHLFLLFSST